MEPDKCYYCGADANDERDYYVHTMYYIHKRMKMWVGYEYSSKQVRIPRCKRCHSKHDSFGLIWSSVLFLGLSGVVFWKFYQVSGRLGISLFGAGLMSAFVTGLMVWFAERVFFQKTKGIPAADDIDRYPIVHEMLKGGWVKSRPDPASLPETGEEKKTSEAEQKNSKLGDT